MPILIARLLSWIGFALVAGFILVTTVRAETAIFAMSNDASQGHCNGINPAFATYMVASR